MSFKNKKLLKKFLLLTLSLVVVVFIVGMVSDTAFADGEDSGYVGGKIEDGMGWLLEKAITAVRKVAHLFLSLAMHLLNLTTSNRLYEDVLFSETSLKAIDIGWRLVRDFVNMFFVLILVFIAVCTILQIPRYSDKKLIAWVIFGALMVNFSKPIALVFIDASNLAMNFFIENIGAESSDLSAMLLHTSRYAEIFQGNNLGDSVDFIVLSVTEIVFTIILATMIGILAVSLLLRIFAFWILIVLSPLAFFGFVLPSFSGMKSSWFSKMTTYAFYGPLMLFFLWLALTLLTGLSWDQLNNPGSQLGTMTGSSFGQQSKSFFSSAMGILVPYAATIYFLYYGFDLSRDMASKAGKGMSSLMQKGTGYLQKAQKGAMWAGAGVAGLGAAGVAGAGLTAAGAAAGAGGLAGGIWTKNRAKAVGANVKDTLSKKKLARHLTKEGRKAASEESEAKHKKAGLFGAPGTTDKGVAYNKMVNKKANEKLDEWKDFGAPSKDDLRSMLSGGDEVKAAAAARYMADKGMLGINSKTGENHYTQARSIFAKRGDNNMVGRIDEMAKKNNLRSFLQYKVDYDNNEEAKKDLNDRVSKHLKTLEESGRTITDETRAETTQKVKDEMRGEVIGGKLKSMSVNELIKSPDLFVDEDGKSLYTDEVKNNIASGQASEQEKIIGEFAEKTKERVATSGLKVDQLRQQVSSNPKVGAAQDIWTQEISESAQGGGEHNEYLQRASNPGGSSTGNTGTSSSSGPGSTGASSQQTSSATGSSGSSGGGGGSTGDFNNQGVGPV